MSLSEATKNSNSTTEGRQKGVAALDRGLSILAALEAAPEARTLAEISRDTGLYKSTILRLLESLQAAGYVVRVQDSRYALGPTIYRLGQAYERRNPLRDHLVPIMERLVEADAESPSFHVRQGASTRICLFRLDSRHSTLDRVQVGDLLPLDRGAAGRVILAFDENADGAEGQRIRRDLYAVSLGERDVSCAGIAAPVFSTGGRLIGALSLSGPRERFYPENIERMRVLLLSAAKEATESLGGSFPDVRL
ncbi:MAG: IclR family transcriptional regulator [Ectothiorhodospiraceae bacterium]|nr:IclR family transcriptional regulator [Ectothiorhodospiraceae bacterium]MCH8504173.1 IclR family transcriptional regulator [Ectothiorhodospiraceae bacterium]